MIGTGPAQTAVDNTRWGAMIIEELTRLNTPLFCVSPGSRSTPLTAALAARPELAQRVVIDERGAAFCALGASKATRRPAVLITTSGTAMANALPAVIEAERSGIPMLLISTDRPAELRESGANQTIDQIKLFGDRVRWFAELPPPGSGYPAPAMLTTLAEAVHRAQCQPSGPVHLNVQFREPLGPSGAFVPPDDPRLRDWWRGSTPWSTVHPPHAVVPPQAIEQAVEKIAGARRGLLVVGALGSDAHWTGIKPLADALGWPILTDVGAGMEPRRHPNSTPLLDAMLGQDAFRQAFAPDVIVQIGGAVVSKRFLAWLSEHPPREHILLRTDPRRHDPGHTVTLRMHGDVHIAADALTTHIRTRDLGASQQAAAALVGLHSAAAVAVDGVLADTPGLHEPGVARLVSAEAQALFVGNSMPIRDLDRLGVPGCTRLAVQRGASGIDGLIATAAGWAEAHGTPTVALIGDVSTLHDLSSLAMLRTQRTPLRVVIINNGGGGIFSFLPVASAAMGFESHFATAHPFRFAPLVEALQLPCHCPADLDALRQRLRTPHTGTEIIEVITERTQNVALHNRIQAAVFSAMEHTP